MMKLLLLLSLCAVALAAPGPKLADGCVQGVNCVEPACRCSSTSVPLGLDPLNIPQIVFLTIDESVTAFNYPNYTHILGNRVNPNGCPISMTFNVIHDFTDYVYLNSLYKKGNEIGMHTISRKTDLEYWKNAAAAIWKEEMDGLKTIASTWANIPRNALTGSRAPFLQSGGDRMIEGLISSNIQNDMSFPTRLYVDPPIWPYTLDYRSTQDCPIPPCPSESHPGFWITPMINLFNGEQYCAMADSCPIQNVTANQKDFLLSNFYRHYNQTRAPFGIHAHGAWFQGQPGVLDGYVEFLDEILQKDDVFVVSVQKGIEWMKNPTSLTDIPSFEPWSCPSEIVAPCSSNICEYIDVEGPETGGDRLVRGCLRSCPPNYPWVGNPTGS